MNGYYQKWRIILFAVLTSLFAVLILLRFSKLAFTPKEQIIPKSPVIERGSILDRNGKQLAVQTNFYHIGVSPKNISDPEKFAEDISVAIGIEKSEILDIIREGLKKEKSNFVYIKKNMNISMYEDLKKITDAKKYYFVRYDKIPGRIYPESTLASQLIGYMGTDGKGLAGIEFSMDQILSPVPKEGEVKPEQGKNIYLTIDANLQYKLEKIAHDALTETQAENLMLLAASAKTGEIISYLSLPEANLNEYRSASIEEKIDRPAATFFEPGSVFKVFSIAAAYDAGLFRQDESFYCDGIFEKTMTSGEKVRITCLTPHHYQTARGALEVSCNDITAQITDRMDTEAFLAKLRAFGFGQKTGLEVPLETPGSLPDPQKRHWSARSKMTISIGQEVGVSALQILQAATALGNNGTPIKLTVISQIKDNEGNVIYKHEPVYKDRILKPDTAAYILSCMQTGAEKGIGWRANLGDITIGVKTGTAQMADTVNGGYSDTDFLSDCLAFFPAENPEIILYICLQKSKGVNFASRIVAPVIKDSANAIIDHLGMSRGGAASLEHSGRISITGKPAVKIGNTVPDFRGMSKRDILPLLERNDIQININGNGWVVEQNPPAGTAVQENMVIELTLE